MSHVYTVDNATYYYIHHAINTMSCTLTKILMSTSTINIPQIGFTFFLLISEIKHDRGNFTGVLSGGFGFQDDENYLVKKDRGMILFFFSFHFHCIQSRSISSNGRIICSTPV